MHKCILYKKKDDKKVECQACNWYCNIPDGLTGICGIRQNKGGDLYLLVYGKAVAVHVDHIEKKPLFHFLPGTKIFSFGTVGCNFHCLFCQNWDISQVRLKDESEVIGEDLSPKDAVKYCLENDIPSIAYTYNEPAIFFEYAYDTAKLAHKHGIKNVFVSNGYESKEALKKIHPYLDAINIDLKGFTKEFYQDVCSAKLEPVLENIKRTYEMGIWLEVTTLVIPGKNDSDEELTKIAEYIAGVSKEIPWHVTAFYPQYKMMDTPPTSSEALERAYKIGKKAGLNYVYTGNIPGMEAESTHCPKCNELIIKRFGLDCESCNVDKEGKCKNCKNKIPGVWK